MRREDIELSRRYADILRVRGNSERTIDNYIYAVKGFAQFLGERSLRTATADDIMAHQSAIKASGRSDSCVRVATYALRGFLERVLERDDAKLARLPRPREPKRLPEVLSGEEVAAILEAAPSPKYRAAFMLCYGAGLRTDEVVHLLPRHIDAQRMLIRVEEGKGKKDRTVMLSPSLLEELRSCWRRYAPKCYLLEHCRELLGVEAPLLLAPPGESRNAAIRRIFGFEPELCPTCKLGRLIVRAEWRATRLPLDAVLDTLAPRGP
jgi:site-specific recombinase XerD